MLERADVASPALRPRRPLVVLERAGAQIRAAIDHRERRGPQAKIAPGGVDERPLLACGGQE